MNRESARITRSVQAKEKAAEQERVLRAAYSKVFRSAAGKVVLEDLIERFDPVLTEIPPNGEAALWLTAVRRVMNHIREMLRADYASAMARVDGRGGQ